MASPDFEFLDAREKAALAMPQPYGCDPGHGDAIGQADLDAGERVLNDMLHERQRSLEGIGLTGLGLEARGVNVVASATRRSSHACRIDVDSPLLLSHSNSIVTLCSWESSTRRIAWSAWGTPSTRKV